MPIPGASPDYTRQQSDSTIEAVAVGEEKAQKFIENNTIRVTPSLTGTKFRILYWLPDRARAKPGTNDRSEVTVPNMYKELVIYTSAPITLDWDTPSRSYVSRNAFDAVIRTVRRRCRQCRVGIKDHRHFRHRVVQDASRHPRQLCSDLPDQFRTISRYHNPSTGIVRYVWHVTRMDGQTAQGSDLRRRALTRPTSRPCKTPARWTA